jgi:geranylgeranyl pyrophosphate synthase/phytoene/squalene synthetase
VNEADHRLKRLESDLLPRIMELIDRAAREDSPAGSPLVEMTRYHLDTGGKRLRALLPCLVAETLGADPHAAIPFGAACEMLHNATLVHDDLQDGDTHRRGRPTIWSKYGAPQAINLGDAMFHYTVLLIERLDLPADARAELLRASVRDTIRIIDGQEREFALKLEARPDFEAYLQMVRGKTSALMALAMGGGAIVAGAPRELVQAARKVADHLGILFQIQDDVLDLFGEKGRDRVGEDVAEGKRSCMVVHALATLAEPDRTRLQHILELPKTETRESHIREVKELLRHGGSLSFSLRQIRVHRAAALDAAGRTGHRDFARLAEHLADRFVAPIASVEDPGTAQVGPLAGTEERESAAFELKMLPEVSRTFALSIEALPAPLRDAVRTAYLLCRIVDTIEDDPRIELERRNALFGAFRDLLRGTGDVEAFRNAPEWRAPGADAELCRGAHHVFDSFGRLDPGMQAAIRPSVLEMAEGMQQYRSRVARDGQVRIRDFEDLDRYCYFVAGTVGRLLTGLFLRFAPPNEPGLGSELERKAVPFGQGLQLVNVLKDVDADLARGVCFVPEVLLEEHGLSRAEFEALDPAARRPVWRKVAERARGHLEDAVEYTLAWPAEGPGRAVRFFCAVPLGLALATLAVLETDPARSKIDRARVLAIFSDAREAAGDDGRLRAFFAALHSAAPRPSAVGE